METWWLKSDSRPRDPEKEDVEGGTCEEMEEQSVSRQKELDEG